MSPAKADGKGGGPKRVAAARAEKEQEPEGKSFSYKGLTFELPDMLPDTVLFDMAEIDATGGQNPMPLFKMLRSILGGEQFGELRNALAAGEEAKASDKKAVRAEDLDSIVSGVFAQYGIGPGESSG